MSARPGHLAAVLWALCPTASAAAADGAPQPEGTGTVKVRVIGFRNHDGHALVALFRTPKGFPNQVVHAHDKVAAKIKRRQAAVVFDKVPAGEVAIAVHHDENGDFVLNTRFFGIPVEGYGASRDARRRFGPPRFRDARLVLASGETKTITIRIAY